MRNSEKYLEHEQVALHYAVIALQVCCLLKEKWERGCVSADLCIKKQVFPPHQYVFQFLVYKFALQPVVVSAAGGAN